MELEVEVQQVVERLSCDFSDRALADACEDGIEEFAREGGADTSRSVFIVYLVVRMEETIVRKEDVHPTIRDPANSQTVDESPMSTFKESMIDLKI
jgi:hypothetical protein